MMWRSKAPKPPATPLDENQSVVLYPALGQIQGSSRVAKINLAGTLTAPGKLTLPRKMLIGVLRRLMRVDRESLETALFQERIAGFMATGGKSRSLQLEVGSNRFPCTISTRRDGGIQDLMTVDLDAAGFDDEIRDGAWWLPIEVATPASDARGFSGTAQLLPTHGFSVISDIDDTVKRTVVSCRRTMLRNTFLNEFDLYDDLATTYRKWADEGAAFHYVSSSPWQLFGPLKRFFDEQNLPWGSFHLRAFRLRDQMFGRLLFGKRSGKTPIVTGIVSRFPNRKFVLVGDSGEIDPEIYASVAQRYPGRVKKILIRRVGGKNCTANRFNKAFRKLPRDAWQTFEDAGEFAGVDLFGD